MPLFEGYNYGAEKSAVIIDIGCAYTKVGFAGENAPRAIVPSTFKSSKTNKILKVYSYNTDEELYANLVEFIHILYFRHLLVNPKERRVVVVESLLAPSVFRNTLAKVMFKHYEVPSVLFAPGHLVALFTLGIPSGLVLDSGYQETLTVPVFEGIPILKAWEALPLAGKSLHNYLEAQLLESSTIKIGPEEEKTLPSVMDKVKEEILEDIKVRCCFVTKLTRGKEIQAAFRAGGDASKLPTPPPAIDYPLDGSSILHIEGKVREHTCEVLFERDNEERSLATLLLDSLIKCPIDMRVTLAENIILIGGNTMLMGFHSRLKAEIDDLRAQPKYRDSLAIKDFKFHKVPGKENYIGWLGGAIFGALETLASRSLQKETYLETGIVPDWSTLTPFDDKNLSTPTKK